MRKRGVEQEQQVVAMPGVVGIEIGEPSATGSSHGPIARCTHTKVRAREQTDDAGLERSCSTTIWLSVHLPFALKRLRWLASDLLLLS